MLDEKKLKMKKHVLVFWAAVSLLASIPLFSMIYAREPAKGKHQLSVRAGYGYVPFDGKSLTLPTRDYGKELRSGVTWDAQYSFVKRWFGVGALYTGFTSEGSHANGSDQVFAHYVAPQLIFGVPLENDRFQLRVNLGAGYMFYLNDSRIYGKERIVKGGNIGGNFGLEGGWRFSNHWGLSVQLQYILSLLHDVDVDYHGETIQVTYPADMLKQSRMSVTVGLTCYF